MSGELVMWSIFERPADFPDGFIARKFVITSGEVTPTRDAMVCRQLEPIRNEMMRRGLYCLPREERDPPMLLESWF